MEIVKSYRFDGGSRPTAPAGRAGTANAVVEGRFLPALAESKDFDQYPLWGAKGGLLFNKLKRPGAFSYLRARAADLAGGAGGCCV